MIIWIIYFILAAYFSENHANVNLIEVNWLQGAYNLAYFPSAARVSSVGKTIGKFIGLNQGKFKLEEFIIVGHSLGAHAAGFGRNENIKISLNR